MQWEVWAIPTANLITAEASEAEALAVVRDLLASDWTADELTLIFEDEALSIDDLPPAVTGVDLVCRVEAHYPPATRRPA